MDSRVKTCPTLEFEGRRYRRVVRRHILFSLCGVASNGGKSIAEVDVAVSLLEPSAIVFHRKELLGGQDLVEQLRATPLYPGEAPLLGDPRS